MGKQANTRPIADLSELEDYFRLAAKPRSDWRIGIEQEKLATTADGRPVPYDGPKGIAELLRRLEEDGYESQREDGHIIALRRDGEAITIEPGGQIEMSGPTVRTAVDCGVALARHIREVTAAARPLDIRFIHGGFRPFGLPRDVPWVPKRRYAVMRKYLPSKGRLAHEMMQRTATIQANLDYSDEDDATDKIRTAYGLTSLVTALFASSPISEGRPNGYKSYRAAVWLETDEDRCGLLPFAFTSTFRFKDYVDWALDVPMFFLQREGEYRPAGGITFRRFVREGLESEKATMSDWELHLSTLFPEVRLKRYIELRGADAAPVAFAGALAALWRGVLEDPDDRAAAYGLVAGHTMEEREDLRRQVPRAGLAARLGSRPLAELAPELLKIAARGLARVPGGEGDVAVLSPLEAMARDGRCQADDMLNDFEELKGDPSKLVERWRIR